MYYYALKYYNFLFLNFILIYIAIDHVINIKFLRVINGKNIDSITIGFTMEFSLNYFLEIIYR